MDLRRELVSIVMPAYNAQAFVGEAIASVCGQTHTEWELLVIDDCSADDTIGEARKWAERDHRVRVLRTPRNGGTSAARNLGLADCRGRRVAFLDADDVWRAEKLARQLEFMEERRAAFSFTAYRKLVPEGPGGVVHAKDAVSWRDMLKGNRIGCSTVMLDAEACGPLRFPTGLGRQEDYALWLSLLRGGGRAFGLDEPLVLYRVHESSKSARKLPSVIAQWRVYREFERLTPIRSAWYLAHYAVRGMLKSLQ
jgi:teichuronic acid biosynthesis glycosyltransferase TuaG